MVVDILLIILVLVALLVAAITDLRSREVPDWVSYMLIAGALLIRLWYAFTSGFWSYFFFGLAGLGVGVLLGLGLFFSKQWGGGDAKLLMGFGVVFATNPFWYTSNVPFYVAFLFNMIVVGALYGLIASVLLGLVHYHDVARAMADLGKKKWLRFAKIVSLIVAVGIYLFVVMADIVAGWMLLVIASIIVVYPWLLQAMKAVEQTCLLRKIPVAKVTEGDWLVDNALRKKFGIPSWGIEVKQIKKLQVSNIKQVWVKEGIPFVPALLLAVIVSLVFGFWLPLF